MADFTSNFHTFEPSVSFLDSADQSIGLINQFPELTPSVIDTNLNFQSFMGISNDNLFAKQLPEFPGNLAEIFPGIFHHGDKNVVQVSEPFVSRDDSNETKKRKALEVSETSSGYSSPPVSKNRIVTRKNSLRRGKRMKTNEKEEKKQKEVVHVRARRGQATDSHSLAERVRRGKINDRLRCLQDIVPGCYKTMGMAVMLDEIINYVQSLQNQVEFLSMRLTAASQFYDFNSESDSIETLQRAKAYEAQKVQRIVTEGYEGLASNQLGSFDLSFGCYPSLPYNK